MVDVEYLTVDEAAQTLRCVKRDKIYLLVRSGIIKGCLLYTSPSPRDA